MTGNYSELVTSLRGKTRCKFNRRFSSGLAQAYAAAVT